MLIGITGNIGHGKTTFADMLADCAPTSQHYESSDIIIEVANALKMQKLPLADDPASISAWLSALPLFLAQFAHYVPAQKLSTIGSADIKTEPDAFSALFNYITLITKSPALRSVTITRANKDQFRPLLQWLGGYVATRVDGQIWFREIVRRAHLSNSDLTLAGGVRFLADAECLRAAGGIIIQISRPATDKAFLNDITESQRSLIQADSNVINDGTLLNLRSIAHKLYTDVKQDNLQIHYATIA